MNITPPQKLWGYLARWKAHVQPQVMQGTTIGDFAVRPIRFELRDVEVDGLDLGTEGHVECYLVEGEDRCCLLAQRESTFYQEEGAPAVDYLKRKLKQGDGVVTPRWHKCDGQWPAEGDEPYVFVGQGYFGRKVIYLFRHPASGHLVIFWDDVTRQDAEEHYAEEDARTA